AYMKLIDKIRSVKKAEDSATEMNRAVKLAREELIRSVETAVNVRDKSPEYKDKLGASRLIFDISKGVQEVKKDIENKNYYLIQIHNSLCGTNPLGSKKVIDKISNSVKDNGRKGNREKESAKRVLYKQSKEKQVS
ncbi:MAG: hypothetical protein ACE5GU_13475, partial [Candidatus Scalinduaceae bacterium]